MLLALCMALIAPASAQQVTQPAPGSALRAELLDAARPAFEKDVGGGIEFVVKRLNVMGDWAFGNVRLQRPGGAAIDWSNTQYASDFKQGMFDPGGSFFLLHRSGGWRLVEFSTGPTDLVWDGWVTDHKLPRRLFEYDRN